jgi:hypothetical protein
VCKPSYAPGVLLTCWFHPYPLNAIPFFPTLCNKMSSVKMLIVSSQAIVGGAPMNAALLNPSSCLIVPLSNGQSLCG